MDTSLVDQVVDIAQRVVASGAISANGHGNVSVRVPGAEELYFTAGPSLRDHPPSAVVRLGLDGTLLEGELPAIQGAVVAMHTAMYADNPEVGCVLHTHSPHATAYAVAHRPIGCWVEALAMFGLASGVPVAGYGPRGSDQAVAGIRAAVTPGGPAGLPGHPRGGAGGPAAARADPTRRWPASGPRSPRAFPRCCWPTTGCWSSTAPRSWPSWSAGSLRRPPRRASTQAGSAARSSSRKSFGPRLCSAP